MNTEEILQSINFKYEDKGTKLQALCPFHNDHKPSMIIYKESGWFKCYACQANGPLSKLVEKITGSTVDFKPTYSVYESKVQNRSLRIHDFNIDGNVLSIHDNKFVEEYCWSIGLTNEFIDFFNVKYFKKATFIDPNIEYTDTRKPHNYYSRIVIPCYYEGKILNYECRDYTKKSSVKVLYPLDAENDFLFNWDNIDVNETVYVTEGIKGLSHVWSFYSHNVVSTFGQILKPNQKKLLMKCKDICRVLDNDENKIDKNTQKPVDNIMKCIVEMDTFYDREFTIAYPQFNGADPANLTRIQIKEMLDNRKTASAMLIERSGLFKKEIDNFNDSLS